MSRAHIVATGIPWRWVEPSGPRCLPSPGHSGRPGVASAESDNEVTLARLELAPCQVGVEARSWTWPFLAPRPRA
jgi:hypothetical protein